MNFISKKTAAHRRPTWIKFSARFLIFVLLTNLAIQTNLWSGEGQDCPGALQKAEDDYRFGFFQAVVDSLVSCSENNFYEKLLEQAKSARKLNEDGAIDELTRINVQEVLPEEIRALARIQFLRSRKLLALCYLALDEPEKAKKIIKDTKYILEMDPRTDPKQFSEMVKDEQKNRSKKSRKKLLWIGGGALAVAGVVTFFALREAQAEKLPDPPALP